MIDITLCDEILQEIFHRLPYSFSPTVSLVSKRWLHLLRSSQTTLSLRVLSHAPSLSSFLSHHPYLSSLSISTTTHNLLPSISTSCPNLLHLRLSTPPLSHSSLLSLSTSLPRLTSLYISLSRPLSFHWLPSFLSLQHLSVILIGDDKFTSTITHPDEEIHLLSLSLFGIRHGDDSVDWIWRNCSNLHKLKLTSCEGLGGDNDHFSNCVNSLQELEIRKSRTIVDKILSNLSRNSTALNSLSIYDGGSKEGLRQFLSQNNSTLRKLDLRLPLDLDDTHLSLIAENFKGLLSLKLRSCCLITGEGIGRIGVGLSNLEELGLINCDVIEQKSGLLVNLGQNVKGLRRLDLSYNDMLGDKELVGMFISCDCVVEVKLRGCKMLSDSVMVTMVKNCKNLECVDIMQCGGVGEEGIELFVVNSRRLRRIEVEERKLSDVARMWVANKFIQIVSE